MLDKIGESEEIGLSTPWVVVTALFAILLGCLLGQVGRLRAKLERLSVVDDLTTVFNQRYFDRSLRLEIARLRRSQPGFSLLLVDLENLGAYRDAHGHRAGDEVLRLAAQTLTASVRETDLVARYGNGTFAVLAVGADPNGAVVLGEKLRARLESAAPLTACVGVATFAKDGRKANDLIAAADLAVSRAKRDGENRVCAA